MTGGIQLLKEFPDYIFLYIKQLFSQMNLKTRGILKCLLPALPFRNKEESVEDKLTAVPVRFCVVKNTDKLRIRNRKIIFGRISGFSQNCEEG